MGRSRTPASLDRSRAGRPSRSRLWLAVLVGVLASGGCDAPIDAHGLEVPLREVLAMSPDDARALPLEARLRLRERFEEAMREQRAHERVAEDPRRATSELVRAFDAERAEHGDDALVLLAVDRAPGLELAPGDGVLTELRTLALETGDAGVEHREPVGFVIDDEARLLDAAMVRAIDGPARPWLERMAIDRGVRVIVPSPLAPAAVLGDAEAVHVSPTWLALLGSLDDEDAATSSAALVYGPLGHHSTASTGFGCYESCDCRSGLFGGGSDCTCNYCGMDWGLCATECGESGEGCHCRAPRPPRSGGSPLDPIFIALPAAYLLLRRRPR